MNAKFRSRGKWDGIDWVDAIDPADKCGYAWAFEPDHKAPARSQKFEPGASVKVARFIAVGTSPAAALGEIAERHGPVGTLQGAMIDDEGKGIASGRVAITIGNSTFPAYPDSAGRISVKLPVGDHQLSIEDIGRETITQRVEIGPAKPTALNAKLGKAAKVVFKITDEAGKDIPCKAQFNPVDGTEKPNLGPTDRAHGCVDQYHSETGSFTVQLPPGSYEVIVTRGPEYGHLKESIKLAPGRTHNFEGQLVRQVDTRGWVSTDYHNHSTPSGDNTCGTDDRIINLAAEHIEYAPTTEHNRLYDWTPHIEKLGLKAHLSTVPGMELTGAGAHFNMFPLKPEPGKQDGGAPVWSKDPRLNAITLRGFQGSATVTAGSTSTIRTWSRISSIATATAMPTEALPISEISSTDWSRRTTATRTFSPALPIASAIHSPAAGASSTSASSSGCSCSTRDCPPGRLPSAMPTTCTAMALAAGGPM